MIEHIKLLFAADTPYLYILAAALLTANIVSFTLFYVDKKRAVKRRYRIRERTLLLSAFLLGALGAIAASRIFRHKTSSAKFRALLPISFIFNCVLIALYIIYL